MDSQCQVLFLIIKDRKVEEGAMTLKARRIQWIIKLIQASDLAALNARQVDVIFYSFNDGKEPI